MTNISKKWKVVREHQVQGAPVHMRPLANDLGLNVLYTDQWQDAVSGMIVADSQASSGYTIYVNGNHAKVRRRFTLAHEISHYILHEELIGDGISDDVLYRSRLTSNIETQANQMAADILMPWDLINQAMDNNINSVSALAEHFMVSKSAMSIRLGVPYET